MVSIKGIKTVTLTAELYDVITLRSCVYQEVFDWTRVDGGHSKASLYNLCFP